MFLRRIIHDKLVLGVSLCALLVSSGYFSNEAVAQSADASATPESFRVTLYEFSLCKDAACQSKLALVSSEQNFDIASASAGQGAGTFGGGNLTIEDGTYRYAYMVWGRTLGLKGRVPFSLSGYDRDCISVAGAGLSDYGGSIGSIVAQGASTTGDASQYISNSGEGEVEFITFLNDTQVATLITLSNPITLNTSSSNSLPAMTVSFNVADTLRVFIDQHESGDPNNWSCEIGLEPPVITFQIGSQTTVIDLNSGGS